MPLRAHSHSNVLAPNRTCSLPPTCSLKHNVLTECDSFARCTHLCGKKIEPACYPIRWTEPAVKWTNTWETCMLAQTLGCLLECMLARFFFWQRAALHQHTNQPACSGTGITDEQPRRPWQRPPGCRADCRSFPRSSAAVLPCSLTANVLAR